MRVDTWALALPLVLAGCGLFTDPEGVEPGECADALDNDEDGLYDCDDAGCDGSADCEEQETEDPCYGYDYDDFVEGYIPALCDKMLVCDFFTDYFTYEDCMALGEQQDTGQQWECEDFDCSAAAACIEEWQVLTCDDLFLGGVTPSCDQVCRND